MTSLLLDLGESLATQRGVADRSDGNRQTAGTRYGYEPDAAIRAFLETEHRRVWRKYFVRFYAWNRPDLAKFAGIPLDIRHVTLSSSLLTMAVGTLGPEEMLTSSFWLAVIGVLSVGVMNVAVSFSLAMLVAIRARAVQAPERRVIYHTILKRAWEQPLSFILPVGKAATMPEAGPIGENVK